MCLCVHVDTVLLCLKHHFQFQQQEWKAMSSSDTSVFFFLTLQIQNTTPKIDSNIILHCLLLLQVTFSAVLYPLLPIKKQGSRNKESEEEESQLWYSESRKKKKKTIRYSF